MQCSLHIPELDRRFLHSIWWNSHRGYKSRPSSVVINPAGKEDMPAAPSHALAPDEYRKYQERVLEDRGVMSTKLYLPDTAWFVPFLSLLVFLLPLPLLPLSFFLP